MGGRSSKGLDEAQQRRLLQVQTVVHGLSRSQKVVHFENLVFEGSGNRAVSYFGSIKVLEELGLLVSFKRYAGVGAGAGWALLLSIGLSPAEIADLQLDKELSYHAKYLHMSSIMPNLAQKFGWSPLGRAVKITRKVLELKTGKQELTFKEVYEMFGKELCIVATNLTTGSLEYFHPKTTPDVPVVDALIMSSTPPGIMKPRYLVRGGKKHYFVDGSVLCNYPVYCYDGWYLSMRKEDSFLSRLQSGSVEPPFKGYNDTTLGLMLVTPGEKDFGELEFLRRLQYEPLARPYTKLARVKGESAQTQTARVVGNDQTAFAGQRLIEHLRLANISGEDTLNMEKFQRALGQGSSPEDIKLLFGLSPDELGVLFTDLERNRESKVTFEEFVEIALQQGGVYNNDGSATTRDLKTTPDMLMAVMSAIEGKSKQVYLKEIDIMRTVGINADYVSAVDTLEIQDKNFLVLQGDAACLAFLLEYIQNFAPQEQLPIPQIYSALPDRISRAGSIIDPGEMQDYSAPPNLYPTLPPSYASAIGDSDHLRDTIETSWPAPGASLYPGLTEEKRPPTFTPIVVGNPTRGDAWGLPVAPVPTHTSGAVFRPEPVPTHTSGAVFRPEPVPTHTSGAVFRPEPQPVIHRQSPTLVQCAPTQGCGPTIVQQSYKPQHCAQTSNPQQSVYPGLQVSGGGVQKQFFHTQPVTSQNRIVFNSSPTGQQRHHVIQVASQGSPLASPCVQRQPVAAPAQGVLVIGSGNVHQRASPVGLQHPQQQQQQQRVKVRRPDGREQYLIVG